MKLKEIKCTKCGAKHQVNYLACSGYYTLCPKCK